MLLLNITPSLLTLAFASLIPAAFLWLLIKFWYDPHELFIWKKRGRLLLLILTADIILMLVTHQNHLSVFERLYLVLQLFMVGLSFALIYFLPPVKKSSHPLKLTSPTKEQHRPSTTPLAVIHPAPSSNRFIPERSSSSLAEPLILPLSTKATLTKASGTPMLLIGDIGSGKEAIARSLAQSQQLPFLKLTTEMFRGVYPSEVNTLFDQWLSAAKLGAPVVAYIEELHLFLGWNKEEHITEAVQEKLLAFLISPPHSVNVIASTSNQAALRERLTLNGVTFTQVVVENLSAEDRILLAQQTLKTLPVAEEIAWEGFAEVTEGRTVRDILSVSLATKEKVASRLRRGEDPLGLTRRDLAESLSILLQRPS